MARFNKIVLASQMFVEAHERFDKASREIDYVTSLMLAGAVCGIVSPLLKEQGKGTFRVLLASLFKTTPNLDIDADLRKEAAWMLGGCPRRFQ